MSRIKGTLRSKTLWGAAIAFLATILNMAGITLDSATQEGLVNDAVTLAGVLFAIYGRLTATTQLSGAVTPESPAPPTAQRR